MTLTLERLTKEFQKLPFDCGDKELNFYFKKYALKNQSLGFGTCFVGIDEKRNIVGFITLSNSKMDPGEVPGNLPKYSPPSLLLGRMGVGIAFQGQHTVGPWLMKKVFEKAVDVSEVSGLYAVEVQALNERAKRFYLRFGFIPLADRPMTLFLPLETIRRAMAL